MSTLVFNYMLIDALMYLHIFPHCDIKHHYSGSLLQDRGFLTSASFLKYIKQIRYKF